MPNAATPSEIFAAIKSGSVSDIQSLINTHAPEETRRLISVRLEGESHLDRRALLATVHKITTLK